MPEFRNPNQGGGGSQDNRSFLLMMIVALGVIFGLQYWRAQKNPALESPEHPAAVSAPAASTSSPAPATPAAASSTATRAQATPAVVAAAQSTTTVENTLYKITFSNQGGQVTSWILKKYKDNAGNPLDMVHRGRGQALRLSALPLHLRLRPQPAARNRALRPLGYRNPTGPPQPHLQVLPGQSLGHQDLHLL